jgi:signal peptidase I
MPDVSLGGPDFVELATDILSKGDKLRFRARGASMHPFIRDGDIIEVKPTEASAIRLGDVIFYRSSRGLLLAHRVIKVSVQHGQEALVTKGDSASSLDQLVYPEQVLGRVVAIKRRDRKIRLDRGVYHRINVVWAMLSPLSPWFYPVLRKAKRGVRKMADITLKRQP